MIETLVRETDERAAQPVPEFRVSHAVLLGLSQIAKWLLRLIFVLVVARALGPERFGVYALMFAMVEFLAVASGSGYADYLTREAAKDARAGWGLALQLMSLRIVIAIPVAAMEIGVLRLMHYPRALLASTAWMALTVAPRSLSEAVQGVLRGLHRYTSYAVIDATLGAGLVCGAVVLAVRHGGLATVIATEIAAAGAASLAGLAIAWKYKTRERIWLTGAHLVKRSAIFNAYSFIGSLYDRFDVILLSKLVGDQAAGIYSVAYRALSMTQIVAYGVLYSLLPGLSKNAGGRDGRRRLERATLLLLCTAFAMVLATMVFAGPAVRFLLGERYAESAAALKILVWAMILRYINCALNIALLAAGRERILASTSLVCLAVNFIGNLVFIPLYSWRAAAVITIVTELVLLGQNVYWMRRTESGISFPWGLARPSLVFVALLGVTLAGGRLGLPLVAGTACLMVFGAYLYGSGIVTEFAAVWETERSTGG